VRPSIRRLLSIPWLGWSQQGVFHPWRSLLASSQAFGVSFSLLLSSGIPSTTSPASRLQFQYVQPRHLFGWFWDRIGMIQHWCWISQKYLAWRIVAEYVWLWTALLFSLITYIPLYLWMRGNLVLNEQTWWKCSFVLVQESDPAIRNRRRSSLMMLAWVSVDWMFF